MGVVVLYQMLGLMLGKEVRNSISNEAMGQASPPEAQKLTLEPNGSCSPGLISL